MTTGDAGRRSSSRGAGARLAGRTDFYRAWEIVDAADRFPAAVRSRAFATWVGLFGVIDHDNVVTEKTEAIAERFSVSRASWLQYRRLLSEVGLIEQGRGHADRRPTIIRLLPPLR
jgi:hypothetical protein